MPAFLTHWRILIETARRSQDAGSDLGSLIVDAAALQRRLQGSSSSSTGSRPSTPPQTTPAGAVWDTGPLPEIDYRFPGSDISAMAYLGALAPDITSYHKLHFRNKISDIYQKRWTSKYQSADRHLPWAKLLHSNRSGDLLLAFLEQSADIPSPALRSQALAFCLGYLSHIATDIALNPWINALASAYRQQEITGLFTPLGPHFYVELCMDEYIAATYFEHDLYSWTNQPWVNYIEPAARNLGIPRTLAAQVLELLTSAAEATYDLKEEQKSTFHADYLAGLQRLRLYLAGRGIFRWYIFNARIRRRYNDPVIATIAAHRQDAGIVTFEGAIEYAIRLSERLCRRAISYYASLRNTRATAEERNMRRTLLSEDLRNWDLSTGYSLDISFDQEITLRFLHNWIHFDDLWQKEAMSI